MKLATNYGSCTAKGIFGLYHAELAIGLLTASLITLVCCTVATGAIGEQVIYDVNLISGLPN